jgi:DnaJ-class molecular chaperone
MQCEKCRGTGLDPATTPAMNVKCEHCVGGKVIAKRQNVAVEEYIEDEKGDIKPVYVIRSNKTLLN